MADELFVGQIPPGCEVRIITHSKSGDLVTLTSQALESAKEPTALYIKPLQNREGKYYTLKGMSVKASAVVNGKIYFFPLEEVPIVLHKGTHVHAIVCSKAQKPTNRREDVRVKLSAAAALAPAGTKINSEAYVFDISRSGIGVNVRGEVEVEKGTEVIVGFNYRPGRVTESYKVATMVVHSKYNPQTGITKLGLKFLKQYPKVGDLVTFIQREELKKITHDREN